LPADDTWQTVVISSISRMVVVLRFSLYMRADITVSSSLYEPTLRSAVPYLLLSSSRLVDRSERESIVATIVESF
jgi:hypothetical protein